MPNILIVFPNILRVSKAPSLWISPRSPFLAVLLGNPCLTVGRLGAPFGFRPAQAQALLSRMARLRNLARPWGALPARICPMRDTGAAEGTQGGSAAGFRATMGKEALTPKLRHGATLPGACWVPWAVHYIIMYGMGLRVGERRGMGLAGMGACLRQAGRPNIQKLT